ncbi:hypothetical protein [Limnoglobus roseus]|uniref:BBP7 family outer membrane beta-barrel protein n=1 Tax=Limnoglobus roseus TaxID=2598579 RepID=A0A5C1AJK8_9BACT|nr:hypothetical protein [Limnoglobus roseus]QEL19050.1 hypothetical protein PX52LOC_06104 [Limnoglobus roseus]
MSRAFWKWTCGVAATAIVALPAVGQEVSSQLLETGPELIPVQGPVSPTPRPAQAPRTVPAAPNRVTTPGTAPPTTTPIGTQGATGFGLTAAGTTARPVDLPNMYGDMGGLYNYSPYTQAVTPNGQLVTVLPGQTQRFPAGTAFNRTVDGFTVLTTPTRVPLPPNVVYPPGFLQKLGAGETVAATRLPSGQRSSTEVLVTGQDPRAADGALPVNTVRGAFKVGENESPRPVDRVYLSYNYFHDVNQSLRVPGLPVTDVHRETLGFEKTFLQGDASIGFRLPLLQVTGPDNLNRSSVGDLTIISKFALINNPFEPTSDGSIRGGQVLSTGVAITVPTGGAAAFSAQDPEVHPTVIQPYVGGIMTFRRSYAQFFTSVTVPTDRRDTTYLFNSLQYGYLLYRSPTAANFVTSVTPLIELHVDTPLNNRGITRLPVGAYDVVSFTGGTTFGLGRRSFLNVGANVPVTGPRPYTIEGMAHLNILY